MPTITAAMPIYNQEYTVPMAIESTMEWVNEYIVVDHGCTDRSIEIVKEYQKKYGLNVKLFKLPNTMPLWEVRLFTFKQATGDWIVVADGDHIFHTDGPYNVRNFISQYLSKLRPVTYCVPLVRLVGGLNMRPKGNWIQPPHPTFYRNSRDWIEKTRVVRKKEISGYLPKFTLKRNVEIPVDLPKSKSNKIIRIENWYGVFNVSPFQPLRYLYKYYWWWWEKAEKKRGQMSLEDYIKSKIGHDDLEAEAKRFWKESIEPHIQKWDENKDGQLPKVVRKRLEAII